MRGDLEIHALASAAKSDRAFTSTATDCCSPLREERDRAPAPPVKAVAQRGDTGRALDPYGFTTTRAVLLGAGWRPVLPLGQWTAISTGSSLPMPKNAHAEDCERCPLPA
jgi:hypothetical protein